MFPSVVRRWKGTPFTADAATIMKPCAENGEVELRIMTPALVQLLATWIEATRATIDPSPVSDRYANRKASSVPQMSAPDPVTENVPFENVVLPVAPTAPMSVEDQPLGSGTAVTLIDTAEEMVMALPLSVATAVRV